MKLTKIDSSAQNVSRWSGGTTTQLAISPPEAVYADRDFLWRVSSAVVELPESDFTPLPDYDRFLMILEGELALSHDGGEEYALRALEQTQFDGGSHTFSRGQVTDFNLMLRKGCCDGRMAARKLTCEECWIDALSAECDTHLLYCFDGEVLAEFGGETICLKKGDALLVECSEHDAGGILQGNATVVLAEIKIR